ncbi:MAG: recombinase, partial [Betaproteobacteria bacterium]|nr:recombinase [Betaproteobacteria bacterium]
KKPLNDNGIALIQSLSPSDDNKLHLTTRLIHSSGEWIEDTAVCPIQKQDPQGLGSAISYIRRYSLSAMCAVYADDDDGQSAALNAADYL